jgi:hypothetical protein
VSITGLSFARNDPSPSASLELSVECSTASWTTATTVKCAAASYGGRTRRTAMTVASLVGTLTEQFSYDGTGACGCAPWDVQHHDRLLAVRSSGREQQQPCKRSADGWSRCVRQWAQLRQE